MKKREESYSQLKYQDLLNQDFQIRQAFQAIFQEN